MKLRMNFVATARCKKYEKDAIDSSEPETIDINFVLNETDSMNFLFRFAPSAFKIGDFKILLKYNANNVLAGITLFEGEYIYIVSNPEQFIMEILSGYNKLKMMDKLSTILDIDTDAYNDLMSDNESDIADEFDD